jgi:hypothetical protein
MIKHLFFNLSGTFDEVAIKVFNSLGIVDSYYSGESSNVRSQSYFAIKVFGVVIRLELNSYEYEDEYQYMISVSKDFVNNELKVLAMIESAVLNIVLTLITNNLLIEVAEETSSGLKKHKL